jgi:hypothetical protein
MKQVDELIRGELSAIKSIDVILDKINDESEKSQLYSIRQDHVMAVDKLKRFAGTDYKAPSTESAGPWGSFASAFTGGASFFGDKSALLALKVGEQYGFNQYRKAIKEEGIDAGLKSVIQSDLMPTQEKHLQTINKYLQ